MYKAIGVWSWPKEDDLAAFDEHYDVVHYPLGAKLPGIRRITMLKAGDGAREADMYILVEVYWDDRAAFDTAAQSPEWQAMATDAAGLMQRFGVRLTSVLGEERVEEH